MDTDTYEKLLSIGEVAELFGVTVPTVRVWERDGKLRAVRTPGNQRRFPSTQIDALLTPADAPTSTSPGDVGADAA